MQFLHFGVPTTQEKTWVGNISELKVHCSDPTADPYGIEWLKFDAGSPMHERSAPSRMLRSSSTIWMPPFKGKPFSALRSARRRGSVSRSSTTKERSSNFANRNRHPKPAVAVARDIKKS